MIWLIAKKEVHDNWISHKITLAFALCLTLLIVSTVLALRDYSERLSSYSLSRSEDSFFLGHIASYTFVDNEGKASGRSDMGDMIDTIGIYRRPVELSVLAKGLEDRMNRPIRFVDIRKLGPQVQMDVGNKQERNKLLALFPPIDFLFTSKVMVSLLTILFAFSAIAGEREIGTLKLMFSNSVSRGQLLLGKFLGGYASLAAPFLAAVLIVILLLALSPSAAPGSEGWLRIALVTMVSLVYIAMFFFAGIAVSALTQRSATAVLLLLAIWIVLVLVIPNTGWLIAKQVVEVPSEQQIDTEKFKTARQIEDETEKKHPSTSYMPGYGRYHIEAQPEINQALKAIEERYEALRRNRLSLSRLLSRFSPVSSYVYSIVGLTQTGIGDETKYHSLVRQNQVRVSDELEKAFNAAFRGEFRKNPPPREDVDAYHAWNLKSDKAMYDNFKKSYMPVLSFTFENLSLSETLSAVRLDLMLLLMWIGLAFVSATLAVMRCDVR